MAKAGASAPKSIDPFQLGTTQAESNIATAAAQAGLNNVNTFSPYGSSTFSAYGTGPNGIGPAGYNLNQNLSPELQNLFGKQTSLADLLAGSGYNVGNDVASPANAGAGIVDTAYNNLAGQIPTGPVSFSGLASLPTSATDFSNEVTGAQKAAYDTQAGFLDPQFKQKESDLRQQLADQGIGVGSDAYSRATGDLGRQEDLAYQQARNAGVTAGNEEQSRLFGENLASRTQGANERITQWGQPLAALGSAASTGEGILGGTVSGLTGLSPLGEFSQTGQIPTTVGSNVVSPANFVQAGGIGAANAANRFTAGNTLNNQLFNGLGTLGGAALSGGGGWGGFLGGLGGLFGGSAGGWDAAPALAGSLL